MKVLREILLVRKARFRRWSRSSYALFLSLTCCVSIGNLAQVIEDASLQKQGNSLSEVEENAFETERIRLLRDTLFKKLRELTAEIETTIDSTDNNLLSGILLFER